MKYTKIIVVIIVCLLICSIGVYAIELCNARDIEYNSSDSKWQVDTVEEALNDLYSGTCNVSISEPIIKEGLIPITLDEDGTVHYADTKSKWYNYCEKEWANAVILIDNPSQEYKVGDTIKENDIESYFVWIPKYKYKLWNTGVSSKTVHEIEIEFTTEDTIDEEGISCKTPMTSGSIGNCNNGEWMTHPAFISMGVNGFWVGKFEIGYKDANSTEEAEVNDNDVSKVIVKPDVYSWRGNPVKNFFEVSYNYKRGLDSHMMKNTEWGAIAYLSHSKYGKGYELNINNNSSFKTGYSALLNTNQQSYPGDSGVGEDFNMPYNTNIGYLASTTGNITGIYDMSGGAHEFMASMRKNTYGSSGFDDATLAQYNEKYFDVYQESLSVTEYQYAILGDATMEMGPFDSYKPEDNSIRWRNHWYDDESRFLEVARPWFDRGGGSKYGNIAGQFYFNRNTGIEHNETSSRIV